MELYLVRHTSVNIPKGLCYGQSEVPLNETFIQEASIVKSKLLPISFYSIFSSPSSRCTSLSEYCNYAHITDNRLMEMNFGKWEMQQWDKIEDNRLQKWFDNKRETPATNGESFNEMYKRVSLFLDEVQTSHFSRTKPAEPQRILVFTHAGFILCAKIYAGIVSFKDAFSSVPGFGSITIISL